MRDIIFVFIVILRSLDAKVGLISLAVATVFAAEELEKMVVKPLITPTKGVSKTVYTGVEIDSIDGEKTSVYDTLDLISGVTVD